MAFSVHAFHRAEHEVGTWAWIAFLPPADHTPVDAEVVHQALARFGVQFDCRFKRGVVGDSGYTFEAFHGSCAFPGGRHLPVDFITFGWPLYLHKWVPDRLYETWLLAVARAAHQGRAAWALRYSDGFHSDEQVAYLDRRWWVDASTVIQGRSPPAPFEVWRNPHLSPETLGGLRLQGQGPFGPWYVYRVG